jgi:hypothetical protein
MRAISVRRTNARTGREETETYQVRIPKGVQAGQSIRVTGKGGEGSNGGSAGDIYLRVRYAQHPDWQVRGADLMGHLELAPWEAVLGATVPVPNVGRQRFSQSPRRFSAGAKTACPGQRVARRRCQARRSLRRGFHSSPAPHQQRGRAFVETVGDTIHVQSEEDRLSKIYVVSTPKI